MLRLILGRAGTGKTALLFSEIAARCARRQSGSFLIVPEQYSHEAERELAQRCGDTASLYAEVLSFSRLAHRVAIGCGGSARVYIDKPGRFLQLSLALEQVGGALSVYGGSARSPERMVQLLSALDELRFGCTAPDALRKAPRPRSRASCAISRFCRRRSTRSPRSPAPIPPGGSTCWPSSFPAAHGSAAQSFISTASRTSPRRSFTTPPFRTKRLPAAA